MRGARQPRTGSRQFCIYRSSSSLFHKSSGSSSYWHQCKVASLLHLQTAIYQAILADSQGSLRTKTVHSEVLWALSPTNNVRLTSCTLFYRLSHFIFKITEALRRYGVSDTGTALFVVRIAPTKEENVQDKMNATIKGYIVPVNTLQQLTDWSAIRKVYQIA